MTSFRFDQIGIVKTPYPEKFAIPRQPGLVPVVKGEILLQGQYNHEDYVRGLEQFSHLWLSFIFHQHIDKPIKPLIRPPRLGGNKKVGVFASRSTYRPNPIGLSVVKLESVYKEKSQVVIEISGMDLLDGTPLVDIKPYIPYSDSIDNAIGGYAESHPETIDVIFKPSAKTQLKMLEENYPNLEQILLSLLAQNPRPAYQKDQPDKEYGMGLFDLNISWQQKGNVINVIRIVKIE